MSTAEALKNAATGTSTDPTKRLVMFFDRHKNQISAALPKHITADRMCRLALTAFHQNKDLMKCDPKTVFGAVVLASQMGLEIGVNGQGYLIPYKGKATFVPGWKGLVDLVARAGRATVWTGAVFEGDDFDFELGDSPFVRHKPRGESDPTKLIATYAIGRVKGSDWPVIEVWTVDRLRKHRAKNNKVGDSHYSYQHWEMYCRKVPLLQVIKYLPSSIEVQNAIEVSNLAEEGRSAIIEGDFVSVTDEETGEVTKTAAAPAAEAGAGTGVPGTPPASAAAPGEAEATDKKQDAPDSHTLKDPSLQEAVNGLEGILTEAAMTQYCNGLPVKIREDSKFQKCVKARLKVINAPPTEFDKLKRRLESATSLDMLDADADLIPSYQTKEQDQLRDTYLKRKSILEGAQ